MFQMRCLRIFPHGQSLAVGAILGRCGIHYLNNRGPFSFRCHRVNKQYCHSVNAVEIISNSSLYTAGSDGGITAWNYEKRSLLFQFRPVPLPITAIALNSSKNLLAYASCYDWSKGLSGYNPKTPVRLYIHVPGYNERG